VFDWIEADSGLEKVSILLVLNGLGEKKGGTDPGFLAAICSIRSRAFDNPETHSAHPAFLSGAPENMSNLGSESISLYLRHPADDFKKLE
jgi:hypothetical protein